jgi:predicted phosphate transport protein (TIGR00153 family)
MSLIFRLFRRSPFPLLQQHFAQGQACARRLTLLLDQALAGEWDLAQRTEGEIVDLEEQADELKRGLRGQLPKDIFLPVSRNDLLQTLQLQDAIANTSRDIARLVVSRRLELPEPLQQAYRDFLASALDTVDLAVRAINELDELVEAGFRGSRVRQVEEMLLQLDRQEAVSDQFELLIREKLRGLERELFPVDVMFLYRLIEWTGDLADHAQRIGHRLTLMTAR